MGAQDKDSIDSVPDAEGQAACCAPAERVLAARETLLRIAAPRLGPPDAATRAAIESIDDSGLLDDLALRALSVSSWSDLVARA